MIRHFLPYFVTHVVTATLILALAMVAARLLPLTARSRHALLLAGFFSFAVPPALVAALLAGLGITLARPISAIVQPLRFLGATGTKGSVSVGTSTDFLTIAAGLYFIAALAMLARTLLLRRAVRTAAVLSSTPPLPTDLAALRRVQRRLGITRAIDLLRTGIAEAPAVAGILRPVILLPSHEDAALDELEVESLLCHECAHVARHDNLIGLLESVVASVFWPHPLMHLAQRQIGAAREEACDETVSRAMNETDSYLQALTKVCTHALTTIAGAGVSCMANPNLTERIRHLMSIETVSKRALNHRVVVTLSVMSMLLITAAAGLLSAGTPATKNQRYKLNIHITPRHEQRSKSFHFEVVEKATGAILAHPSLTLGDNDTENTGTDVAGRRFDVTVDDRHRVITLVVTEGKNEIERDYSAYTVENEKVAPPKDGPFTGEPISLNLKDAEVQGVMKTFAALTGAKFVVAPNVHGTVTMDVRDVPWDEVLDRIGKNLGLQIRVEGKTIYVDQK